MSADEIIQEAQALPPEERAAVVDSILRSLNPPDPDIDEQWIALARERLADYRSGDTQPVPGADVISKLNELTSPE